jgi:hypothetical protein
MLKPKVDWLANQTMMREDLEEKLGINCARIYGLIGNSNGLHRLEWKVGGYNVKGEINGYDT